MDQEVGTAPVLNPSGDLVDIPQEQVQDALSQGYRQPTQADFDKMALQEKHGSPTEMAKTFIENAAEAATFGVSRHIETHGLHIKPSEQRARNEANPITATAGQVTGLVGSAFVPGGEGALLERAGQTGAEALGLTGKSLVSKVGSGAVKGAIENSLFQAGDEVAKRALIDPDQTAGTAAANIGISGLIGGGIGTAFGTMSQLWEATTGGRLKSYLDLVKGRANGETVPYDAAVKGAINQALESGMEISPEIKASLSSDPELRQMHAELLDSAAKPGINLKKATDDFYQKVEEHALKNVGASPEYLNALSNKSDYQLAKGVSDDFVKTLKDHVTPISEMYEAFEKRAGKVPLTNEHDILADKIGQWAMDNRLVGRENIGEELYNYAMKRLPGMKDVIDLKNLQQDIWAKAKGNMPFLSGEAGYFAGQLVGMLRDVEQGAVTKTLGEKLGKVELDQFNLARTAYKKMMDDVVEPLGARLGVRAKGAKQFMQAIDEKFSESPEKILRKLNPKDDANLIQLLQKEFPQVADKIRQYHSDEVLWRATKGAAPGEIKTKKLFDIVKDLSPEMRDWMYNQKQQQTLGALNTIQRQLSSIDHNFSGTAKASDVMRKHALAGGMAAASMLMGHGPVIGAILGEASRYLTRDLPDAIKFGLLKYLGSNAETNPKGFAAMVNYMTSVYKGEAQSVKAAKSIFNKAKIVLPTKLTTPEEKKIQKRVQEISDNPEGYMTVSNDIGHYLPEHASSSAGMAINAVNYLNGLKPRPMNSLSFDTEIEPNPVAQSKYSRALNIAENPLTVVHDIKDGSITHDDVVHLSNLYPGLYRNLKDKIIHELIDAKHDGDVVPYNTRIGVSLFTGEPLDSTMTPQAIMSSQPQVAQTQPQQQAPRAKHSMAALNKLGSMNNTPDQAREIRRNRLT